jgi:hypothetical protein
MFGSVIQTMLLPDVNHLLGTVRQTLFSVADLERFRCVRMSRSGACTSESVCRCR